MAAAPPPSGSGSFVTHKLGPLPVWAWLAIGIGVVYVYRKYQGGSSSSSSASQQAAALAAAQAQAGYTPPTQTVTYPGGGSYTGPAGYAIPPGVSGPTPGGGNAAFTPPTGETLLNGGYYVPGGTTPITDAAGSSYTYVASPTQASELQGQGVGLYYQPLPGQFTPAVPGTGQGGVYSGIPIYAKAGG